MSTKSKRHLQTVQGKGMQIANDHENLTSLEIRNAD